MERQIATSNVMQSFFVNQPNLTLNSLLEDENPVDQAIIQGEDVILDHTSTNFITKELTSLINEPMTNQHITASNHSAESVNLQISEIKGGELKN